MSSLDLRLFQEIEQALAEQIEKHATEIVLGRAGDYTDYKFRIGQLRGLREALSIAEDAQKRVLGIPSEEK